MKYSTRLSDAVHLLLFIHLEPDADLSSAAVAIGSEGRGVSEQVLARCEKTLKIPMSSRCESLNAAVAAAVLLWEGYR